MGLRKTGNEESWTDCGENKTFLKIYKIIFSIAKDRNQWIDCCTPEETSERSGDCWWGGGGSQGGKGAKRMFRDLDGFIRKNQAQNGLKMSFFFFGLFFHVFPWFCPLHVFLPLDYFFFFFFPLHCVACGILVSWPGVEPVAHTVEAQSLNPRPPGKSHGSFCFE